MSTFQDIHARFDKESTHDVVSAYYTSLQSTNDLKTTACVSAAKPPKPIMEVIKKIPVEILDKFYGCGCPVPAEIANTGITICDLGSGSGRDVYIAAALVGESGRAIGIDMTSSQLEVSRKYAPDFTKMLGFKHCNIEFIQGYIEEIDKLIPPATVDMIVSNCVVNLSPNKLSVLKSVYSTLKQGGEFCFSDVYCDRRLPVEVTSNQLLFGECIGGALYVQDFIRFSHQVGFLDVREVSRNEIAITDDSLKALIGNAKFWSITYRLFKLDSLETLCEDYGQVAIYKGSLNFAPFSYKLDNHHIFITGKPMLVCGNTASMLSQTWLSKHFNVLGDTSVHYGLFDCGGNQSEPNSVISVTSSSSPSCGSSGCC